MYVSSHNFDWHTAELIFLYIGEYKVLVDCGVNLNAKYETKYADHILHIKNRDSYFEISKNINIKILCGQNGTGKTSITELLMNPTKGKNCFLVYKDESDNFMSNNPVNIIFNRIKITCSNNSIVGRFDETYLSDQSVREDFPTKKNFEHYYSRYKEIIDNYFQEELFSHAQLEPWDMYNESERISASFRRMFKGSDISDFIFHNVFKKNILFYFCFQNIGDNSFEEWIGENYQQIQAEKEKLSQNEKNKASEKKPSLTDINYLDYINSSPSSEEIQLANLFSAMYSLLLPTKTKKHLKVLSKKLNNLLATEIKLATLPSYREKSLHLLREIDTLLRSAFSKKNIHYHDSSVINSLYFNFFKICGTGEKATKRYFQNLSSGEQSALYTISFLVPKIIQEDRMLIIDDEPEKSLHPEWCRKLISNSLKCFELTRNSDLYKDRLKGKKYNWIIATHSPFILSDFPKEHIVFLEKKDGNTAISYPDMNTFAGNISEMFNHNFYMKKTIGDFATHLLQDAIKDMENWDDLKQPRKVEIKNIISEVGDRLLKKLLLDKYRMVSNENH